MNAHKLLWCDKHGNVPGGVICVHLADGTSKEWHRVSDLGPGLEEAVNDWLCPNCLRNIDNLSVDDVTTACVFCVREGRGETG